MRVWFYNNGGIGLICLHIVTTTLTFAFYSLTTNLQNSVPVNAISVHSPGNG